MLLYQLKISQEDENTRVSTPTPKPTLLKTHMPIHDIAYWQKRALELLPDCTITCQVAK